MTGPDPHTAPLPDRGALAPVLTNLIDFGRVLRIRGLDVHSGRMLDVIQALQHVDISSRDEVYHTCRALLVHRREDLGLFDRTFDQFWRGTIRRQKKSARPAAPPAPEAPDASEKTAAPPRASLSPRLLQEAVSAVASPHEAAARTWSDVATFAQKDFSEFTADEIALARAAVDRIVWDPGRRRTRRWVAGRGRRIDVRAALARSLRTGGDTVVLPRRRRRLRPRAIVLLCDVSGSMEPYSRMLLHFAHAMSRRHGRVEAFVFSTAVTRITPELRLSRLDEAAAAAARIVPDWSGGTRIGDSLRQFHQRWTRRVLHRAPVVLLVSDGWDRGEPAILRDQVARLQRSCHRLIWLNPLIGTTDYAPLTRALQAALPHVDDFLPVRTLTNLVDLALHLNSLATSAHARSAPARPRRSPGGGGYGGASARRR
jgi:uncharacterized protein with von Willebrand factor type A (vWA) domain